MKLITVEAAFAAADLDTAISLFTAQAETVRNMAGCAHYALYRKPSDAASLYFSIGTRWTRLTPTGKGTPSRSLEPGYVL